LIEGAGEILPFSFGTKARAMWLQPEAARALG
jgi:hypothetical protein